MSFKLAYATSHSRSGVISKNIQPHHRMNFPRSIIGKILSPVWFRATFGSRWWQFVGPALMNVILPKEYYQVQLNGSLVFDELGWWHYQRDLEKFEGIESEADRIAHSRFLFYCAHGMMLFNNRVQALQYAMRRIGYEPAEPPTLNPQVWLDLEAAINRAGKTVPA